MSNFKGIDVVSETWCVTSCHSLQIDNGGQSRSCCMMEGRSNSRIGVNSIEEHFNTEELKKVREDLNNGIRNIKCTRCWQEEDAGKDSKRIRDNRKYSERLAKGLSPYNGLAVMELNLGNTCNLRCRTCGPQSSSQWVKEYYDLKYADKVDYKTYAVEIKKFNDSYDNDSAFWADLETYLPNIKQFDFYGGEPFMSKKMWRILEIAVEKGYAKDIELHYATNGSFWPESTSLWKNFKHVHLSFSVDGVGEQFEYVRYLANWNNVKSNMDKAIEYRAIHKNMFLSWCVTLSNLNIYELPSIIEEHKNNFSSINLYLNLVHHPKQFNTSFMPDDVKQQVLARLKTLPQIGQLKQLEGIIGFIENGTYNPVEWSNFLKELKITDEYRNENYETIFPEFAKIIGYTK